MSKYIDINVCAYVRACCNRPSNLLHKTVTPSTTHYSRRVTSHSTQLQQSSHVITVPELLLVRRSKKKKHAHTPTDTSAREGINVCIYLSSRKFTPQNYLKQISLPRPLFIMKFVLTSWTWLWGAMPTSSVHMSWD